MKRFCICMSALMLIPSTSWCSDCCFRGRPVPRCETFAVTEFRADISPGLTFLWASNDQVKLPSFTGSLRLSYRDYVALVGSMEVVRKMQWEGNLPSFSGEKTFTAFYLGVTAQSTPGIVLSSLAGFVYLIASSGEFDQSPY